MLSGVGPRDQLDQFGIPVVHEAPGVGQNLWNHAITTVSYKVKEGTVLAADNLGTRIALRYTAEGSPHVSDMMMTTSSMFNALTGETIDDGTARVTCVLELPEGSGWVRLASADPTVQPSFNYRYFEHPEDTRRLRDGVRMAAAMLETEAYRRHLRGPDRSYGRSAERRRPARPLDEAHGQLGPPCFRHLHDRSGRRPHGGGGPAVQGQGHRGRLGGGLVGDTQGAASQHQRHGHNDRRKGGRLAVMSLL